MNTTKLWVLMIGLCVGLGLVASVMAAVRPKAFEQIENVAHSTLNQAISSGKAEVSFLGGDQSRSIWFMIIMTFLAGFFISLTPCFYPMIPIIIGVLHLHQIQSMRRVIGLACAYVLGGAVVYAIIGFFASSLWFIFGVWMGNPYVVGMLVIFLLYLALSMFGLYDIPFLHWAASFKYYKETSYLSAFVLGTFSVFMTSVCRTPVLISLLSYVAELNNPVYGAILMFSFACGFGIILVVAGIFSEVLKKLPQPGAWMNDVMQMMGFFVIYLAESLMWPYMLKWQQWLMAALFYGSVSAFYMLTARVESVLHMIKTHESNTIYSLHGKNSVRPFIGSFISLRTLAKKMIAFAALAIALFCCLKVYLVYNKTTLIDVVYFAMKSV